MEKRIKKVLAAWFSDLPAINATVFSHVFLLNRQYFINKNYSTTNSFLLRRRWFLDINLVFFMVCLVTMVELEVAKSQKLFSICPIFYSKGWDILRRYFSFPQNFYPNHHPSSFQHRVKILWTVIRFGFLGWYQI